MILNIEHALGAWYPLLSDEFKKPYMMNIGMTLMKDKENLEPALGNVFRAFSLCPPDKLKVVIIGQDPYPGGHADGLSFSSGLQDMPAPYSLKIIYEELEVEGFGKRSKLSLEDWAEQGVLLLNTHLTTLTGAINAHADIGWDQFTGTVLNLAVAMPNIVYLVWGRPASNIITRYVENIPGSAGLILKHTHPAANRYGYKFAGCGHFEKANEYLIANRKEPIKWV